MIVSRDLCKSVLFTQHHAWRGGGEGRGPEQENLGPRPENQHTQTKYHHHVAYGFTEKTSIYKVSILCNINPQKYDARKLNCSKK